MIVVDSSVWINYFNGRATPGCTKLNDILNEQRLTLKQLALGGASVGRGRIVVGDLILAEVLQGFAPDNEFAAARIMLTHFQMVELGGRQNAIQAAKNFRRLRALGIRFRGTIDTLIATKCIESGYELLYDDRDFDPFVQHLGLRAVL